MSALIKEFAKQARYDAINEMHYLERIHNREITLYEYQEIYDQKLFKLIAAEVISKAEDYGLGNDAVEHLKEYFGVE